MSRREYLNVLDILDAARVQWYHFKAIIITGMGFFTDSYNLFTFSIVAKLLGRLYYTEPNGLTPGILPPKVDYFVYGVPLCVTVVGQLFFGCLGDKLGRRKVYGVTLILMVVCALASGFSFGQSPNGVISTLCFFRFWLGFGIGGDYPLSATIMSEYANKKTRGAFMAAVFAMQGFGILAGGIVSLAVSAIFKNRWHAPRYSVDPVASLPPQSDYIWRIILMFGAIPAAMTYYWRMQMPETARYTALVAKDARQAAIDMSSVLQVELEAEQDVVDRVTKQTYGLFSKEFLRRHGVHLFGCSMCWLLLDIGYYSQNLFQNDVFSSIGWLPSPETMSGPDEVYKVARAQTLIALCGLIPGYGVTVAFIDDLGRFAIQLIGFFFMSVFMFALAVPYHHWKNNSNPFLAMYSLTFFFANFGPNSTTFIIPAEIFPARLRSTCYGIAAASGKIGALIGTLGFLSLAQGDPDRRSISRDKAVKKALLILSEINAFGVAFTFLVPEAKGKSLEEWEGEEEGEDNRGVQIKVACH
ncbi:putative inorganic phosphate transporter 1-7 [Morella rubra]|uniref:Putative inorganic phosphate transporter 1-7 n=1 Tax=Morella rubra TaxID=262757 RepID=A0A6A1W4H8_9ROSI|nr:putative inorganic phosphate transporter 1-7 [Morella rubra]